MTIVVDDHVLMACLALTEPAVVRRHRRRGRLFTSGLWYHRLCRALGTIPLAGSLSGRLGGLPADDAARVLASCQFLPDAVRVLSLGELGWPMAQLLGDHRLNLLQLEALASAQELDATICVWEGDRSPALAAAAESVGVPFITVPL